LIRGEPLRYRDRRSPINWLSSAFVDSFEESRVHLIIHAVIYAVPVFGFAYPAFAGLLLLAGKIGRSRTVKNVGGPAILIIGWVTAMGIQFYWAKLLQWVTG
jgi:hypothetical protein